MWRACFDESYDPNGWFVVAGLAATRSTWRTFKTKWSAELAREPSIPHFSVKSTHQLQVPGSPFYGWTATATRSKAASLYRLISEIDAKRLVAMFRLRDFRAVMNRSSLDDRLQDPYLLGYIGALILACKFTATLARPVRPTEVELDKWTDKKRQNRAQRLLDYLNGGTPRLGSQLPDECKWLPSRADFLDDHGGNEPELGLQAADAVAWHYRDALKKHEAKAQWTNKRLMGREAIGITTWNHKVIDQWKWVLKEYAVENLGHYDPRTPWI